MTIAQGSDRAIIDWKSFSIGGGNSVFFQNGSGATLNRVTGALPTSLNGLLTATGSVYLVNPGGIIVGQNGRVDVGGSFVAATHDVDNSQFLTGGNLEFAGTSKASVVSLGTIDAAHGDVALIARRVENAGTITASNGTVGLAAGYDVLLTDGATGDGKLQVKIGGADTSVTTSGDIAAAEVELRTNGGNIYALAGNNGGTINATGVASKGGRVFLTAGGGTVSVASKVQIKAQKPVLVASAPTPAPAPGFRGGEVTISGTEVNLGGSVEVTAAEGGSISVAGTTIVADGSLDASATEIGGKGGSITLVASDTLSGTGTFTARGGDVGQGGFVETSGHNVDFSGFSVDTRAPNGVTGTWLVDPEDITVDAAAATTISSNLATTSVVLQTTATTASGVGTITSGGAGDITIDSTISWSSGNSLTLDAYHSIFINAPVSVSGGGGVALTTNNGGSGGTLGFGLTNGGFSGRIDYGNTDHGGTLSINGTPYTLLYAMGEVQGINADDAALQGDYALATSLNASSYLTTNTWMPIGTDGAWSVANTGEGYSGRFTGLGNTISNLAVNIGGLAGYAGLFGYATGTISDIGSQGGSVAGATYIGSLVGYLGGSVINAYATGSVTGNYEVGGLVGELEEGGDITNSHATGTVGGVSDVGGLVGSVNPGTITNSYATGNVAGSSSSSNVGGLVGLSLNSTITNSHATGVVTGTTQLGGLVGYFNAGTIKDTYATGRVEGNFDVGGLVGIVRGDGSVASSFATGDVKGVGRVGGLVAQLNYGSIDNAYATGAVIGSGAKIGGLVGQLNVGTVTSVYATGMVSGADKVGGLIGALDDGTVAYGFWDTDTSGTTTGLGLDANAQSAHVTGLSTTDLQGVPLAGFDGSVWGNGAGLYPYLKWRYPTAPQAISGVVFSDSGITTSPATIVTGIADGVLLGTTTSGANGYYYVLADGGTITDGSAVLAIAQTAPDGGTRFAWASDARDTNGNIPGFDIYNAYNIIWTKAESYSAVDFPSLANQAVGSLTSPTVSATGAWIEATAARFSMDVVAGGSQDVTIRSAGDLTIAAGLTIGGAHDLALIAGGALAIDAPITITDAGTVSLAYDTGDPANLGFGLTASGFAGSIDFGATDKGGSLAINGNPYTLIYTMGQLDAIDGINGFTDASIAVYGPGYDGRYAFATSIDATSTGTYAKAPVHNFNGTIEGLGNAITNFSVDNQTFHPYVGLIRQTSGAMLRDIGVLDANVVAGDITRAGILVGNSKSTLFNIITSGEISGGNSGFYSTYVGGVVGYQGAKSATNIYSSADVGVGNAATYGAYAGGAFGWISGDTYVDNAHATGTVTGGEGIGDNLYLGGLIGQSYAAADPSIGKVGDIIINSTASGSVTGGKNTVAGGLIGKSRGTITNSYATGPVNGGDESYVGGLVGYNLRTISAVYATGVVTGGTNSMIGGLVGTNEAATITDGYWDVATSGTTAGIGLDNNGQTVHGLTTAALQGGLPSGFDAAIWGTGAGLYPYLKAQYPVTPQAISGTAYSDWGTTPLASGTSGAVTVSALADGAAIGSASTGANGYYYILMNGQTLDGSKQVLTYLDGNAINANTLVENADPAPSLSGADLYGSALHLISNAGSVSTMFDEVTTAMGGTTNGDMLYAGSSLTADSVRITSSSTSGFDLDRILSLWSGTLTIDAAGTVTQSAQVATLGLELLGADASYALTDRSNIAATLAADTGSVSYINGEALFIGTVNGTAGITGTGAVTVRSLNNLTIRSGATVTAGSGSDVVLATERAFTNNAGSSAISVSGGGRWLVYSSEPIGDSFGGLDSGNVALWNATYQNTPPADVTPTGNRYLFAYRPTLSITTTDVIKTYGEDATATVAGAYDVTGLQAGISGAFLGDTLANTFSGLPNVSSSGSAATSDAGNYAITATSGTLAPFRGYAVNVLNTGVLTVNKAALTVSANNKFMLADGLPFPGPYTVTYDGLKSWDNAALLGTPNFGGSAVSATDIGTYDIVPGGLASANYTISYADGFLMIVDPASVLPHPFDGPQPGPTFSPIGVSGAFDSFATGSIGIGTQTPQVPECGTWALDQLCKNEPHPLNWTPDERIFFFPS